MSAITHTLETLVSAQKPTATDFYKANFHGYIGKILALITGRIHQLLDLEKIVCSRVTRCRRFAGTFTVQIDNIKGSEGRCGDFDQDFNPLKLHNRDRWLSIANAWYQGIGLPAVELIKIGDAYIVRDGHHRISVARYMGADFIDARVTEWELEN